MQHLCDLPDTIPVHIHVHCRYCPQMLGMVQPVLVYCRLCRKYMLVNVLISSMSFYF